ncbi:penicillin-binding protein 1C [soil metagenome]
MFAAWRTDRRAVQVTAAIVFTIGAGLVVLDRVFALPLPDPGDQGFTIVANDGTPLRTYPSAGGVWRQPVTIEAVSPRYLEALLGYEDRWFWTHDGVNALALGRAAIQWVGTGRIVSGGSTLTMQVARLIDPRTRSRSIKAKLIQSARALQLEAHLSKREILTLYLNFAPMGGAVEGVEMGSRAWLGKPALELSHAEAALLAALPQSPTRLRPDRAAGAARRSRDKVLQRLLDNRTWDAATVADARLEHVFAPPMHAIQIAPLAAERLKQQHARLRDTDDARIVETTIDAGIQLHLEQLLLDRLGVLPDKSSIAALVVDNDSLEVRGYAGSADFTDSNRAAHVDMVRAVRSPGSTLKPFLYAMALDEGLIHSESLLIDAPQSFGGYSPGNFQAAFSGPVSVSEALQRSLNVPAVDLLDRVGPERFAAHLRNAGLRLRTPGNALPNLSIILGGAGTTLEELVGAYTSLARNGIAGKPRLERDAPVVDTPLMSPGAAFIVREILENGGRPDTPFHERNAGIAWKTGTSFGFRDAWAIGVTDRFTVGVWIGRPDGTPSPGYFGANTAAPLVKDLFAAIDTDPPRARHRPAEVKAVDVCWPLGRAAGITPEDQCLVRRSAWSLDGGTPPTLPDRLRSAGLLQTIWTDGTQGRIGNGCALTAAATRHEVATWPTLLGPWIPNEWRSPLQRAAVAAPCNSANPARQLRIVGVDSGMKLRAAPGSARIASVRVEAIGAEGPVTWLLDGKPMLARSRTTTFALDQPGRHALAALEASGRYDRVEFEIESTP